MPQLAKIYLLKDLARLSGHSIHTVKFYLKRGLIQAAGRSPETRFRYFDDATLASLSTIRALRKERKSLSEIHHLLNNHHAVGSGLPGPPTTILWAGAGRVEGSGPLSRAQSPEPPAILR